MKLGKRDSAIIFKDDGSVECVIPSGRDNGMVPGCAMRALALYHMLAEDEDKPLIEKIDAHVEEMIRLARAKQQA